MIKNQNVNHKDICIYVCMYVCVYKYICICTFILICIHTYIHIYTGRVVLKIQLFQNTKWIN